MMSLPPGRGGGQRRPTGRVQALDRAFVVLRELVAAPQGATAVDLARATGIERTTVHRLLRTLAHWGMVTGNDGVYFLGPESLVFATAHVNRLNLRRVALLYAVELQEKVLQERRALVSLSVPARDQVVIIERTWSPQTPMNVIIDIGDNFPLEASASGKSILSTYTEAQAREAIGAERLESVTAALDKIRRADGFSTSRGQFKAGLLSLAYPIFGAVGGLAAGAMVISGLDLDDALSARSPIAEHLRRACRNISSQLSRA